MISNLKEHYKELREELDDLLVTYDIPKEYWHNMTWLNANISKYFGNDGYYRDFSKTINLIHKLSPTPLTRLHSINYDD